MSDNRLPRRLAYMRLGEIRPAVNNGGRVHDLPMIMSSMRQLGFADPLIDDERTGRLVGGHGRVEGLVAMQENSEPPPEGIVLDEDGEWLVPVFTGWKSADDGSASALLMSFNRGPANARYSDYGLASLIEQVATTHAELLDATGYDEKAIDELLRYVTPERLNEPDPDDPFTERERPAAADDSTADVLPDDAPGTPDVLDSDRPPLVTCPECQCEFAPRDANRADRDG